MDADLFAFALLTCWLLLVALGVRWVWSKW
jgi:hypothetical protein